MTERRIIEVDNFIRDMYFSVDRAVEDISSTFNNIEKIRIYKLRGVNRPNYCVMINVCFEGDLVLKLTYQYKSQKYIHYEFIEYLTFANYSLILDNSDVYNLVAEIKKEIKEHASRYSSDISTKATKKILSYRNVIK